VKTKHRSSVPLSRRTFLAGAGAGAVALPFIDVLKGKADTTAPKRFIAMMTPNGTIADEWVPTGGETTFVLKRILEPLEPFRDKLLILDGMDMRIPGATGGHQAGPGALLTGQGLQEGDFCGGNNCAERSGWPAGHSIDQEIARTLDGVTPFSSLELGVRIRSGDQRRHISYRAINDPLPHIDNPYDVFDRVFGAVTGSTDPMMLENLRRREQSVLDAVRGDLGQLRRALGNEHGERLDAHMESLRDVERRLSARIDAALMACEPPMLGERIDHTAEANFPLVGQMQLDLITAAIACDRTRVVTLVWSGETSGQRFPWLDLPEVADENGNPTTAHHAYSHVSDRAREQLVEINRWYSQQLAYLLQKLDSIPEPSGEGTLLDNTVVFLGNGLSNGDTHSRNDMKFVVAGGAGGFFRTGRYLRLAGRHHNDLLVSFANAMGLPITTFGNAAYCDGPLTEIHAS
jgi:hypothetical protein